MKSSHSRLGVLILISLLIVGLGITGANAATSSSPSLFKSATSFFQGLLPTTGYAGSGSTTYTVQVTKEGDGTGTVTSGESPVKISCGSTCYASYTGGSTVTLTATPAGYSRFASW